MTAGVKGVYPMASSIVSPVERRLAELKAKYNELMAQKKSLEAQKSAIQEVLNTIEEFGEDVPIYKLTGNILVRVKKKDVVEKLKGDMEVIEIRIASIEKQLRVLDKEIKELLEKIRPRTAPTREEKGGAG